jgi:hypothetical protein
MILFRIKWAHIMHCTLQGPIVTLVFQWVTIHRDREVDLVVVLKALSSRLTGMAAGSPYLTTGAVYVF